MGESNSENSGRNECGSKVGYVVIEHSLSSFIMMMVAWNGSPLMTPMLAAGWGISSVRKKFSSSSKISSFTMGMLKFALVAPAGKEAENSLPM